ncbi:MAG: YaiI/YqxD family protein [Candidatus Riflebacteria bacterium]|nr:YaiI/YqxD family protein [Candidatus Riflebacteria bacterium]
MSLPRIYVDADACPVKDEVYRVADRYGLLVMLVANTQLRFPEEKNVKLVVVDDFPDAADDWIAVQVERDDIVITGDIPLAARCVKVGARVLGHGGREFTEDNIGQALATRSILTSLREQGTMIGGPPPFQKKDRSRFLQSLDTVVQSIRRKPAGN